MEISIVLLTHKNLELAQQCLESIRKHADKSYEIIIVDNESTEEMTDYLNKQSDIKVIFNQDNLGIAKAYNLGAALAGGECILFMNQYSFLTENCLNNMLNLLKSEDNSGMVGPVSNNVSGHQHVPIPYQDLSDLKSFARQNQALNRGNSQQVFRLLSHCLLVKSKLLLEIGGFDERFGLGTYEDDDLCLRAFNQGYTLHIALDAFVHYSDPLSLPGAAVDSYYQLLAENRQKAIAKWGFDIANYLLSKRVPVSISLCMIVKNEQEVLARCLDCVEEIADEIIIVDTGSTDDTKKIARCYTEQIFDFIWIDDFAAARNFAFSKASKEYVMWLDADDILETDDRKKMLALKKSLDPSIDSVTMNYHLGFDDYGNVTASLRRNRLVRRSRNFQWIGAVHEYLAVNGKIIDSDIAVTHKSEWHDSDRNLRIYEDRLAAGESFSPRDLYYYANELLDHKLNDKAIEYYQLFLDTEQGWIEDNLSAIRKLVDCLNQKGDHKNAEKYLLQSFLYDIPRAEFCCRMGHNFQRTQKFKEAAFWYKLATKLNKPSDNWGFIDHACWTWLPHLQLCVCYDKLGDYELANQHNEIAASFIPDDPSILHNREYFQQRLGSGI